MYDMMPNPISLSLSLSLSLRFRTSCHYECEIAEMRGKEQDVEVEATI